MRPKGLAGRRWLQSWTGPWARPAPHAAIGRVDVLILPVDGGYTMNQSAMAQVARDLHARPVIPMHWFSPAALAEFLARMRAEYRILDAGRSEILVSLDNLPEPPAVVVLTPELGPKG